MPTTAPLSREQALYLRCIRRAQEAERMRIEALLKREIEELFHGRNLVE